MIQELVNTLDIEQVKKILRTYSCC